MTITVRQLAEAVNNCKRLTPEDIRSGMSTWEIQILNEHMHIVHHEYHTGWFQEEAERIARNRCTELNESTWQVLLLKEEANNED